jgi:hypothetical protein
MGPKGKLLRILLRTGFLDKYISRLYAIVEEHYYLRDSAPETIAHTREISNLLRIYDPVGKEFVRLGNEFDGGYVIVDTLNSLNSVLALGVGTDVSFEAALSNLVERIDLYDHTVSDLPTPIKNANFIKLGISELDDPNFVTLTKALSSFDTNAQILLKMDIESSEWGVLANSPSSAIGRFQQIVVEFHGLLQISDSVYAKNVISALARLNETHRLVHLHINNYEPVRIIAGVPIPNVLEATYLNVSESEFIELPRARGHVLNHPNNPKKLDVATVIRF